MVYMGIDASTSCTGWSIFEDKKLIDYGAIRPKSDNKDWRLRAKIMFSELNKILAKYNPEKIYVEDVPLKDGKLTLLKLGMIQGIVFSVAFANGAVCEAIPVNEWREKSGLYDGTVKGLKRDAMKRKSVELANSLFDLDLNYIKENSVKNDDDISDSILIGYSSVYPIEQKGFGRKAKI